jgi:hypothetical protein
VQPFMLHYKYLFISLGPPRIADIALLSPGFTWEYNVASLDNPSIVDFHYSPGQLLG